ncbi:putative integral membrane protein [Phaeoacremonium minimum UCRPA7]|uniref:Putative integral membrane protein n=1 Tax=Phaeoacremonium minimum (strain UCR-PA7) TaxID=1286976 RepID=R8BU57_PHAM7|nr:putative integral membrane protein [Phaeoacremonium minimum UCRPA7]EOO02896.1 putative integral membrane protein [Phaeoacremonium minimum UCRPA7]
MASASSAAEQQPGPLNYIAGFLMVGMAWGLTTPFIRRAAKDHRPPPHPLLDSPAVRASWLRARAYGAFFAVVDLLRNPRYAVPLLLNLTGSVWFFLLIGKAELSLTVPIVNTLAFLFTVVGEWWVEKKVISRNTLMGMILSISGIALCVQSKST